MDKLTISEYVKNEKEKSGLTITQFARLHGVSRSQMAKYLSGELDNPSLLVIAKFCNAFALNPEEFDSIINCSNPLANDLVSFSSSINHLMKSEYEVDPKKYIFDFYEKCHDRYQLHDLFEGIFPGFNSRSINGDAMMSCYASNNTEILIEAVKYRKIQKGKRKYYNNELEYTLALPFMYGSPLPKNYLILTPSESLYSFYEKGLYLQQNYNNIILLYYKNKREPKYRVINGYDFLKKNHR